MQCPAPEASQQRGLLCHIYVASQSAWNTDELQEKPCPLGACIMLHKHVRICRRMPQHSCQHCIGKCAGPNCPRKAAPVDFAVDKCATSLLPSTAIAPPSACLQETLTASYDDNRCNSHYCRIDCFCQK